jgi:hypothetical protein
MTTLILTHIQRLNLFLLLQGLECHSTVPGVARRQAWCICQLQDRLKMDDGETAELGLVWSDNGLPSISPGRTIPEKQLEMDEEQIHLICRALDRPDIVYVMGRDRWFHSLQAQLPEPPAPATDKENDVTEVVGAVA